MSAKNTEIRAAIDSMDANKAREILREALPEANSETYYLASLVAFDDAQKKQFLQKALDLDPFHGEAYKAMNPAPVAEAPKPAPVVEAAKPAPVAEAPKPAPAPEKPKTLSISFKSSKALYRYPWPGAPVRTQISSGTSATPLGRTESGNWINVLYIGSTGHEVLGWLPRSEAGEAKYGDKTVNMMDLPISEFQYNTKQDVQDLKGNLNKTRMSKLIFSTLIAALGMVGIFAWIVTDNLVFLYGGGGVAALGMILQWQSHNTFNDEVKFHLGGGGFTYWYGNGFLGGRLEQLRRGKQSVSENMMEDQARIAAMQIAGNMAARSIPNKQEVTVKYR